MKHLKPTKWIIMIALLSISISCTKNNETHVHAPKWLLVYKNAHDGKDLFGSKDKLIHALRAGSPLRIGFGGHGEGDTLRSIEHLAEAEFISIANSKEVFAQINTMIGQRPRLDEEPLTMQFHEDRKFSMIASTNGSISTLSIDFVIDSLHSTSTNNRGFSWYIQRTTAFDKFEEDPPIEPLWKNPRKR